ncbi:unnamed protein product [Cyclocybe aegerita]|uniref:F-box domain-containing protein n=1 Tax=Cyclocybe aegerita TaxID=1973307 RepID=A0A8S0WFV1_CYCAE|nr:unnamed protein product [Cyclocybe aegerita]
MSFLSLFIGFFSPKCQYPTHTIISETHEEPHRSRSNRVEGICRVLSGTHDLAAEFLDIAVDKFPTKSHNRANSQEMTIDFDDENWNVVYCGSDLDSDDSDDPTVFPGFGKGPMDPCACGSEHRPQKVSRRLRKKRKAREPIVPRPSSTRWNVAALPTEILSMIFALAVAESPFVNGGSEEARATESVIALVCARWRSIAIDTPELWTTFRFGDKNEDEWHCWELVSLRFETYLKRAGNRPVDLWIDVSTQTTAEFFLKRFRKHLPRWRRVSMRLPDESTKSYAPALTALTDAGAGNLQSFELLIMQHDELEFFAEPVEGFLHAVPELKHVRMDSKTFKMCMPPLSSITTLHLEAWRFSQPRMTRKTLLSIITSPTLKNLTLQGKKIFNNWRATGRITTNIERLFCEEESVASWMWATFDAPNLKTVILHNFSGIVSPRTNDEGDYFPKLTSITFIDCVITPSCLETIGKAAKHVMDLTVIQDNTLRSMSLVDMTPTLSPLEVLAISSDHGIWPRLKMIECDIKPWRTNIGDACARLLRERSECHLRLHMNASVLNWRKKSQETWKDMQEGGRLIVASPREADFEINAFPPLVKFSWDTIWE